MKTGTKIKYCTHTAFGEEAIETAFVLKDDGGEYIWISDSKEDLKAGIGSTIARSELR